MRTIGSKFSRSLFILVLLSTGLVSSLLPTASATPANVRLAGPNVQNIPLAESRPSLENAYFQVEEGYVDEYGACRFSMSFEAPAGDTTPQFGAVTAVDHSTCQYEVLRGVPMMATLAGGDGQYDEDYATAESAPEPSTVAVAGAYDQQVRFSTYWEDPIQLDVNKVSSSVRTTTSGAYITNAECWNRRYKLTASGWYEQSHSYVFLCERGSDGSWGRSYVEAGFQNDTFCAGNSSFAHYFGNIAYATPYAVSGWINETYVYGGCTGLLSGPYTIFEPGVY